MARNKLVETFIEVAGDEEEVVHAPRVGIEAHEGVVGRPVVLDRLDLRAVGGVRDLAPMAAASGLELDPAVA